MIKSPVPQKNRGYDSPVFRIPVLVVALIRLFGFRVQPLQQPLTHLGFAAIILQACRGRGIQLLGDQ